MAIASIPVVNSPYARIEWEEIRGFDFQWFIKSAVLFLNRASIF